MKTKVGNLVAGFTGAFVGVLMSFMTLGTPITLEPTQRLVQKVSGVTIVLDEKEYICGVQRFTTEE